MKGKKFKSFQLKAGWDKRHDLEMPALMAK